MRANWRIRPRRYYSMRLEELKRVISRGRMWLVYRAARVTSLV